MGIFCDAELKINGVVFVFNYHHAFSLKNFKMCALTDLAHLIHLKFQM